MRVIFKGGCRYVTQLQVKLICNYKAKLVRIVTFTDIRYTW